MQKYYQKKEAIQKKFPFGNNLITESIFHIIENQNYSIKDIKNDNRKINWIEYIDKGNIFIRN